MPRYRRSYANQLVALAIIIALIVARWQGWLPDSPDASSPRRGGLAPGIYQVERTVDGDTLLLSGGQRVRLQGVNCPEIAHEEKPAERLSAEATTFTQRFVRDAGGQLRVEVDGEAADHYGRWLAFVWREDRMLNQELVRAGLARAMLRYDYSQEKKNLLRAAQLEAQRAGRGLWSNE
jgi:micrococcal nuclease